MVNQKCLSDNDRSVLNAIFNPMEIGGDISSDAGYDDDELPVELQGNKFGELVWICVD